MQADFRHARRKMGDEPEQPLARDRAAVVLAEEPVVNRDACPPQHAPHPHRQHPVWRRIGHPAQEVLAASCPPGGQGRFIGNSNRSDAELRCEFGKRVHNSGMLMEMPVPVDMVEKIAQRVVAQISEKVIREIAWEVIPDLAENLIKKEIDRLKAELQQT